MTDEQRSDVIFKWVDSVLDQTNNLWTMSVALFVISILIFGDLHNKSIDKIPIILKAMLIVSMTSMMLSMGVSYIVRGSIISGIEQIMSTSAWSIPAGTEIRSLAQISLFFIGFVCFLVAACSYPRVMSSALVNAIRGR